MILTVGCAAAFSIGLYVMLVRRDLIAVLVGAEMMLGAATVQLFGLATAWGADGAAAAGFGVMVLVIAAAEAAIGLALVVTAHRRTRRTRLDDFQEVRG